MKLYITHTHTSNFLKNPQPGNDKAFHRIWEFVHSQTLGIPWVLINSKSARQRRLWEISVFSLTFPVLCKFTFPIFWELYGFLLLPKYLRNPLLWNVCVFPYFSRTNGIHFFNVLGIVWISASYEIFKKPINLKCFCFPILFPYNGNPLFPYFENCMDFCFKQKSPESLNIEMFVFSHIFPYYGEFTFPIISELYGFLLHPKYLSNPTLWNVCFFPILFPYYGN